MKLQDIKPIVLTEKWKDAAPTDPDKKGMFDGWSLTRLRAKLEKEMKKEKGERDSTMIKELEFAIRAKTGWGKVK